MIRHIVLVQIAARTSEAELEAIFAALRDLKSVVPGMRSMAAGANVSSEGLNRSATHAFTIDFENAAARDAYLVHPDHQAAGARMVAASEHGIESVTVVDLDI